MSLNHPYDIPGYAEIAEAQGWDTVADIRVLTAFILQNDQAREFVRFAQKVADIENGKEST